MIGETDLFYLGQIRGGDTFFRDTLDNTEMPPGELLYFKCKLLPVFAASIALFADEPTFAGQFNKKVKCVSSALSAAPNDLC